MPTRHMLILQKRFYLPIRTLYDIMYANIRIIKPFNLIVLQNNLIQYESNYRPQRSSAICRLFL